MTREEAVQRAVDNFKQGYACSQAVVLAFASEVGLDETVAKRISGTFGGGMGRLRQKCGALTGSFMILGMAKGYDRPDDMDGKMNVYKKVRELNRRVEEKFGTTMAQSMNELFDVVIAKSFEAINSKLDSVNGNMTTLMRCLLVMQENTPEARLAVTKYLSELDAANSEQAEQVRALIEAEMKKYADDKKAKEDAIEQAKAANQKWKEEAEAKEDDGGFGSL